MTQPRTLYDKLIDSHTVCRLDDEGHVLLYIDKQVLNEYTSPQAFSGLRESERQVARPNTHLGVVDHVNPTSVERNESMPDEGGQAQVEYFRENCQDFGIELFDILDKRQGIEHVVMPEQGLILPGMVIAAGDSHTTTYGAFGAFGFGIGTSEIEHLLATQALIYKKLKTMRVTVHGQLAKHVTSKDIVMELVRKIGASGATGYALEFVGEAIEKLSVEARMTICNMAVEAGARGAYMPPDQQVFDYLKNKPRAPKGELWQSALAHWSTLKSDPDAVFDAEIAINVSTLEPMVSWGTSPDQAIPISQLIPAIEVTSEADQRSLLYMGLEASQPIRDLSISHAFIGSCTNARIEDLRSVAKVVKGKKVAEHVRAIVVPGSTLVREQAEQEGIAQILIDSGFEWRQSGCSMCLAMNDDVLKPGDRCASSTNRNFEGRQGAGARTHLMGPSMVAAAAIEGKIVDIREVQ
ncbi:3-isopropylmalate dehydratase large subunit [Vibrio hangzhouensis]|uniref:3-isopropylmalate dehydratase large subunit n=1 Tax=Vibrio hangzhouensis TaxID=462991 RepID=A0A1H5V111_9VIBR|nr:3-isopropylmalate dehydratase large subunit [Vibrio hangzhouensis]SEF81112.1 3-isopropylmalate/(R)-2-methylmalate dehydratase large subunit [Vibrio hangzhouensis]